MKNQKDILVVLMWVVAGAASAGEWQRNTFASTKHVQAGCAPGAGWSHTEAVQDISVSPADLNLRAMIDNEWTAVYTEDGLVPLDFNSAHSDFDAQCQFGKNLNDSEAISKVNGVDFSAQTKSPNEILWLTALGDFN